MNTLLNMRLFLARSANRGWRNSFRLIRYHFHPFRHSSTISKLFNLLAVKCQKHLRCEIVRGMPYRYSLDPTNACNLKCPVCPTGIGKLDRKIGMFDFEAYKAIVEQIAPYAFSLELYNWGEPFLHPRIFEMIEYAHRQRISIRLSSNLNHFSSEMAERTVRSGLDRLIVSIDGSTQEVYEKYRRNGSLEQVLQNVRQLVEAKKQLSKSNPLILMRILVQQHNEHQIGDLRKLHAQLAWMHFPPKVFFIDATDPIQIQE